MAELKYIHIATRPYPIQYTSNALTRLEKETGLSVQVLGTMLVHQRGGLRELQQILWAGLEGARLKHKTRQIAYTLDEVGDLIDEAGGVIEFWDLEGDNVRALMEAFKSAFPSKERPAEPGDAPKDGAEGNAKAAAT